MNGNAVSTVMPFRVKRAVDVYDEPPEAVISTTSTVAVGKLAVLNHSIDGRLSSYSFWLALALPIATVTSARLASGALGSNWIAASQLPNEPENALPSWMPENVIDDAFKSTDQFGSNAASLLTGAPDPERDDRSGAALVTMISTAAALPKAVRAPRPLFCGAFVFRNRPGAMRLRTPCSALNSCLIAPATCKASKASVTQASFE